MNLTFRSSRTAKRIALAAALLGVLGIAAAAALATSAPPAPTISSAPSLLTTSGTASFSFSDSQRGVTFRCSLDGSAYSSCISPNAYPAIGGGSHTFSVEAVDTSSRVSPPTTFSWIVLVAPPAITITYPSSGSAYNGSAWSSGCAQGVGVCGTAKDPGGVSSVTVSIQQASTGRHWNGSAYVSSSAALYLPASLTPVSGGANWLYRLVLPVPDGPYTLRVRATDALGLQTPAASPATSAFTILTVRPAAPVFTQMPPNPNTTATSTFAWTDATSGVTYLCSKENGAFTPCSTPTTYNVATTNNGQHQFAVEAVDAAGNVSAITSYSWKVGAGTPANFTISGNASSLLYPGARATALNLTLTNPNSTSETVTSLSVTPQSIVAPNATAQRACTTSDFAGTAYTGTGFTLPPGTSTLQGLGVPQSQWPTVAMRDTSLNQNGCIGATVTFNYSGSAQL